ncbi:hypothetical protein RhiirA1_402888 [Rhizophagus irregularis]|uniref:Uncharacterized protein n=1 Tax=Rhizophagus irregularis TaxID=588596 RepID=A0A2N0QWK6_9GLOM|nr:hypothetical protein RhiirA1_402888 [Rhizophagus irregularis]
MENIELTCHLHTRPGKNVIRVNTGNDVNFLIGFTSFGFEARINRSIDALRITGSRFTSFGLEARINRSIGALRITGSREIVKLGFRKRNTCTNHLILGEIMVN